MSNVPAVYLPGASGDSSGLRPVAERLSHLGSAILVDYPGLGDAPLDPSIASATDLYSKVIDSLPDRFDLVAMSMGSLFALKAAIEQPERIRRMVLIAPTGGLDLRPFGAVDWREAWRARRPDAPTWFVDDRTDLSERLGTISSPTLLIFGDRDPLSPLTLGDFLLARLPVPSLRVVQGGTHDLEEEYPETVAGYIEAHLR